MRARTSSTTDSELAKVIQTPLKTVTAPRAPTLPANCIPISSGSVLYQTQVAIMARTTRSLSSASRRIERVSVRNVRPRPTFFNYHLRRPKEDLPDFTFQNFKDWTMAYFRTERREIVPSLQRDLNAISAKQPTEKTDQVNSTVERSLSAALESGTLLRIATNVLQDDFISTKFLTSLSTSLMCHKFKMWHTTHFIEKTTRAVLNTLAGQDRKEEERKVALVRSAYARSAQHRSRALRSSMCPSVSKSYPTPCPLYSTPMCHRPTQ